MLLLAAPQALAQSVTLSHGFPTVKTATLTISGHTAAWWHKSDQTNATCVSVAANTSSANLTNLTGGTTYVWKAYSDSSCSTELASTTFTTIAVTIDQITATTARLNLAHNTNRTWSYKQTLPSSPDCQQDGLWGFDPNDSPQSLTNLSPNTSYTFTVYWGGDCAQANEGEAVTFTTSAATLAVSNITKTSATLTISSHSNIAWWYQGNQSGATCTSIAANTLTADLTDLTVGTEYTYKAYNASGCDAANEIASRTFTTEAGKPGAPSNLSSSKTASYHIPTSRWRIKVRMSWTSGANNGTAITSTTVRYRRTNPVGSWWTDSGPSRTEWTPSFWSNVSDRWLARPWNSRSGKPTPRGPAHGPLLPPSPSRSRPPSPPRRPSPPVTSSSACPGPRPSGAALPSPATMCNTVRAVPDPGPTTRTPVPERRRP